MQTYIISGAIMAVIVLQTQVFCESSSPSAEDSIPLLASGKRQHNIMRFGKRPAGGHNLIHFGKRDDDAPPASSRPQHSFLYFGKRDGVDSSNFWDYIQKNGDGSYKRGHSIMRFGKRAPDTHNMLRFGRDPEEEEEEDLDKRSGSNNGHSMMYFGKRSPNNGHSMMYFGKRSPNNGHSMMYFGKRGSSTGNGHSMMYFGKRDGSDEDYDEGFNGKRAHAMIHFGKRDSNEDDDVDPMIYWNPDQLEEKRQHNLLRFGKKMDRKGSHAMIHFGKRDMDDGKRAHAMIHFGKRSIDDAGQANQSSKGPRVKRAVEQTPESLVTLVNYEDPEEMIPLDGNPKIPSVFVPSDAWSPPIEEEFESRYSDYLPEKKDGPKNAFLRFG